MISPKHNESVTERERRLMYGSSRSRKGDQGRRQTLDYRYHLTHDLLINLNRGECCCVVGVGSCGKSRLLLHLARPETLEYHLSDKADDQVIVTVQCNAWSGDTLWAAYEGIARDLGEAIESGTHPAIQKSQRDLQGLYEAVVREPDIAFKHLKTGLNYLLGNTRLKLTLCFDEFDFVFERFDAQLFRNLRALRNAFKYQLTYLLATRKQLPYQRAPESWPDVEEFYELFADNTFAIGPYDERDATEMINDLENRYEFKLQKRTRDMLIEVTGGHSGLIGASFRFLEPERRQPANVQEMERLLVSDQSTWKECVKIWDSLRHDERTALHRLANNSRLSREEQTALGGLKAKGLVHDVGNRGGVAIFSPIFQEFARQTDS